MKKKILAMTLLLAIMASMLVFAACKDDEPDEPKKLLGGFLSPEQSVGNSIIAPFVSCAYESDRFVFDIDDVTLTFYIILNAPCDTEEDNRLGKFCLRPEIADPVYNVVFVHDSENLPCRLPKV